VVLELATRLAARDHVVTVVSQRQIRSLTDRYANVEFREIPGPLPDSIAHYILQARVIRGIIDALDDFRPDVVVANVVPSNYWGALYRVNRPGIRVVWYCHDTTVLGAARSTLHSVAPPMGWMLLLATGNPLFRAFDRWAISHMDYIVANSRYTGQLVRRLYKRDSEVVYPGVDPASYAPSSDRGSYVLAVGQLSRFKNFELAIEALALCKEEFSARKTRMVIVGDGPHRQALVNHAMRFGVAGITEFLGAVRPDELPPLYSRALFTVFPTVSEAFGLVPIESMASGTPTIAVNSGGPAETVVDGRTGILTDPTPIAFARAMTYLLQNQNLIEEMGSEGRAHVLTNFTWERAALAFERALRKNDGNGKTL